MTVQRVRSQSHQGSLHAWLVRTIPRGCSIDGEGVIYVTEFLRHIFHNICDNPGKAGSELMVFLESQRAED